MKRLFLALATLTLTASLAAAQTTSNTPQQTSPEQGKPATQPDATNNAAGSVSGTQQPTAVSPTTANPNPTTQDPTAPTMSHPVPPPQAQQPKGQSPTLPQGEASLPSTNPADSTSLKQQLDQAYQSEPSLSGSNIQVDVTDSQVQLTGSVPSGKEKLTAKRIAQSYAGNRKVADKLTVSGSPASQSTTPQK
ncbi:MAG: BON domain-containing protein [Acidobacteriaceae bacterium]